MSKIILNNVSLTYPIYGHSSRSLKRDIACALTGKKNSFPKVITAVEAIKQVSFSLEDGDYLGLIGHNGAGKSTLLKVLSGIYDISQGKIHVEGQISSLLGSPVGMQLELSGYENIKISSIIQGCTKEQRQHFIHEIETFTELGDFLTLPVKMYSAGMLSRLGFAIATAIHPDILLLDEIVGTGDAHFINKASQRLHDLLHKANILILASHDMNMIKKFCNKALWLEHGRVQALGDVDDVIDQYLSKIREEGEAEVPV